MDVCVVGTKSPHRKSIQATELSLDRAVAGPLGVVDGKAEGSGGSKEKCEVGEEQAATNLTPLRRLAVRNLGTARDATRDASGLALDVGLSANYQGGSSCWSRWSSVQAIRSIRDETIAELSVECSGVAPAGRRR